MPTNPTELVDGVELTATEFQARRSDVTFFVAGGGVLYVTVNGKRRMALVPAHVGEQYEREKKTPDDDSSPREPANATSASSASEVS